MGVEEVGGGGGEAVSAGVEAAEVFGAEGAGADGGEVFE